MTEAHLLITKLTIPPLRPRLLPRTPLIERLNRDCALPLVLLSAGAGFGKTTLLAAWAAQHGGHIAWLSLDRLDNDPLRFWGAVLAAVRTRLPAVGEEAAAQLAAPQPPQLITLMTALVNDLVSAGEDLVLVLDDYHEIDEPSIHASVTFLLDHAPSCLHLVLASRTDPPLSLARLRGRGQVAELRDADLRASDQEAAGFLREVMGLQIGAEDERRLLRRSEGWLVGLQLAALSLARQPDPSAWVTAFGGSQRLILDYMQEEILARQPPAMRRFLLRVSILPRMNASLCRAVTADPASQAMLEALERGNLFVVPLDARQQWYRLHDLFREALLARLQATQPETVPRLYARAAEWYEQQGLVPDAVEVALSAGAWERAAVLIERCIDLASLRNEYHTLCRWLGQLPRETLRAQPALSFWYALAMMYTSLRRTPAFWARIGPLLEWAEQGFEADGRRESLGETLELHAELAFFQGDLVGALALAHRASTLLSKHSIMYATNLLVGGLAPLLAGDLGAAERAFLTGQRMVLSGGNLPATVSASLLLGEVCRIRGDLREAERHYRQALAHAEEDPEIVRQQLMTETGEREPFFLSWAYHDLAQLSYEWDDLAAARHALAQAQALGEGPEGEIHLLTSGGLIRARLLHRGGHVAEAERLLDIWERQARFPWARSAIRAARARLHLALGDLPAVERWANARDDTSDVPTHDGEPALPYAQREEEALLLVRLRLARRQAAEALQDLTAWKERALAQGRTHAVLEILVIEALAHAATGDVPQARSTLIQALRLAAPGQYRRLFLDEGEALAALLRGALPQIREPDLRAYALELVAAFGREQGRAPESPAPGPSPLLEPLTPQEQRVLRLLAEGASNRQIADQLVVSLATARKHVSNILGKLGAVNRTQAIVRAREYALL